MFIRANKTKNKKTGIEYITHRLIESYRTEDGPRQRVIMHLGELTLPKSEWRKLAFVLENKLSGQTIILEEHSEINDLAAKLIDNHKFSKQRQENKLDREEKKELVTIDIQSVSTINSRSLGPELVANAFWEKLEFDKILDKCGLTTKETALAKGTIIGRLIAPDSDLATLKWLKNRTSLIELLGVDVSAIGKNALYEISDILLSHKKTIEKSLRDRETTLFPDDKTLFLYDLTNTYFEGSSKKSNLTNRGKSKEKQSDCPLVTLALLVDSQGFPIFSHIYKGNQSEPETLEDILDRLLEDEETSLLTSRSTLVMDRGIATKDNISLIKKRAYPYIIIERRDAEKDYVSEFETARETFDKIENSKGDTVYVKKIDIENGSRVLCLSEKREQKENAIDTLKESRFVEDILKLQRSIQKGTIKLKEKVFIRIGRLKQKYSTIAKHYEIISELDEADEKIINISLEKKESKDARAILTGCYVIETSHQAMDAKQIWGLYTTLTRVESAFRALKTDLGMRPVHHQLDERIKGHLFISVLAYHLLISIETSLSKKDYNHSWSTIKKDLSTHQRNTVVMTDDKNIIHHVRVSGMPEGIHQKIYKLLGITDPLKKIHQVAGTRL